MARTFEPNRILTFKAIIAAPSPFEPALCDLEPEELIDLAEALTRRQPTEPMAEFDRCLAVLLDQKLAASHPTWSDHRVRVQNEFSICSATRAPPKRSTAASASPSTWGST